MECDGNGGDVTVNDDSDKPNTQCQITSCVNGTPMGTPAPQGTECSVGGGTACDGQGNCVECIVDADCPMGLLCDDNTFSCYSCTDGVQNGGETDIDCGGGKCPYCMQGQKCKIVNDCVGPNTCADGVCCNNACTQPCKACNTAASPGLCDNIPLYEDDPKFGNGESCLSANNLTCNGTGACASTNGSPCAVNGDCASNMCSGGVCAAP
jgi:hypothetical protein